MNGVQIRVGDLLYAIGKRWKMILAFVLVGCGFGAALSAYRMYREIIQITGSTVPLQ